MALSFSGRSSVIRAIDAVCSNKTKRGSALTAMCSGLLLVNHPLVAEHVVLVIAQPEELLKDVGVVLAQAWRAAELVRALAVDQPRDAQRGGPPAVQPFNLRGESARDQVWVAQYLGRLDTRRGGDAVRLQAFGGVLCTPQTSPVRNGEIDGIVVSTTSVSRAQPWIGPQVCAIHQRTERDPFAVRLHAQRHPPVGARRRVAALRRPMRMAV